MLFRKLKLQNFQAHEDLLVEFTPGITTIVGATDRGKSAILRALRWVSMNDFAGSDFVREGADQAEALLTVRDNKQDHVIARVRGKRENTYKLIPFGFNTVVYKSFGQGVPEDLAKLFRVSPVNFQGQLDPHFWFGLGGMELSRQLNAIIDLSVMDTAASNISTYVTRCRERKSHTAENLVTDEEALKAAKAKEPQIADFEALLKLSKKDEEATAEAINFGSYVRQYRLVRNKRRQYEDLEKLVEVAKERADIATKVETLERIICRISESPKEPPSFRVVEEAYEKAVVAYRKAQVLDNLVADLKRRQTIVRAAKLEHESTVRDFKRRMKNEQCPTCGQRINETDTHFLQ